MLVVPRKILQIVNIPSKATQSKTIDLISAPKLLQTAAEDIAQLQWSFDAVLNKASIIASTWGLPRQCRGRWGITDPLTLNAFYLLR